LAAAAPSTHAGAGPTLRAGVRASSWQERVFIASLAIIATHVAAVALLFPGGLGDVARVGVLLADALISVVIGVAFLTHGRVTRGLLAGSVGLGATVAGLGTSVPHAILSGLGGAELTGILATAAGVVLVGQAFAIALAGRRLMTKLAVAIPVCLVILQWLIGPALTVGLATHSPHPAIASARTLGVSGAHDVSFAARDGTRLSGWYAPGTTGAAVLLLHGSHGTRADMVAHLRMLAAAGYGVLAFDARGHGSSFGETNALGWRGADDIAGAVTFVARQPGVDPGRIAALGLSMGAEEALRAAAEGLPLAAVVADGAGASTLGDQRIVSHGPTPIFVSETWLAMRGVELISGESEPAPLKALVGRIGVPVLLIASGATDEHAIDAAYAQRIGSRARLWYIPDAGHTQGVATHPREYANRVDAFLAAALASR
jgi:uncharacterized protein